ncbi:Protein NRT1/ PTR FAMILY 5.16 [Senna tora]|uniref:Protein NRT1/ PTR FAMILY 5.16 n=1 Tax=Senna tora TaxID=362788 RepID=A0A834TQB1_9FABA|nr:Protein NRT1/ PTR FAMILY 5.16 [Senna tora]
MAFASSTSLTPQTFPSNFEPSGIYLCMLKLDKLTYTVQNLGEGNNKHLTYSQKGALFISLDAKPLQKVRESNQNVDEGRNNDGAVTAKKRIGKKSTQKREQRRRSRPDVDVLRRRYSGLPQWARQIIYQVRIDSIAADRQPPEQDRRAGRPLKSTAVSTVSKRSGVSASEWWETAMEWAWITVNRRQEIQVGKVIIKQQNLSTRNWK